MLSQAPPVGRPRAFAAAGQYAIRYACTHDDATADIARLLVTLRDVTDKHRSAHLHCTILPLRSPDDSAPLIVEGRWRGRILHVPRGAFQPDPASNFVHQAPT